MGSPNFWDSQSQAQATIQQLKRCKAEYDPWIDAHRRLEDLAVLLDVVEPEDATSIKEIQSETATLLRDVDRLEFARLLGQPEDRNNAIISLNAGAGGTESCDWTMMLWRMYTHWIESRGFECEVLDKLVGDEAGLKNLTAIVRGSYAYGYLKSERGVHRLVRISPFDSNSRRHTSFASVDVIPELEDDVEVEVKDGDLRIDTYRSSGAGGQHVNVTDSAVRMTHLPTGVVVTCQNERSQHKNRATAMKILKARLQQLERAKREEAIQSSYDQKGEIAWGNQIRSYVLQPYQMVKDLRTEHETSNTGAVLDGDIDAFIQAYLVWSASGE